MAKSFSVVSCLLYLILGLTSAGAKDLVMVAWVEQSHVGLVINADWFFDNRITFSPGSSAPSGNGVIEAVTKLRKSGFSGKVAVIGFSDASGAAPRNFELSEARAREVKRILISGFGLQPDNVYSVGYGEAAPKGLGPFKVGRFVVLAPIEAIVNNARGNGVHVVPLMDCISSEVRRGDKTVVLDDFALKEVCF